MGGARIRAGTSGWNRPAWREIFYPPGLPQERFLAWYARHLDTVEIWRTSYRVPGADTARKWREAVGEDFRFCLRYPRAAAESLEAGEAADFHAFARELGGNAGPLLLTLDRRWGARNAAFVERFIERVPDGLRVAVDGRDPEVFTPGVRAAIAARGFGRVCGGDEYPPPRAGPLLVCVFGRRGEVGTASWAALVRRLGDVSEFYGLFTDEWEGFAPLSALQFGLAAGAAVRDWRGRPPEGDGRLF